MPKNRGRFRGRDGVHGKTTKRVAEPGRPQPEKKASPCAQRQALPFTRVEVFVQEFINLKPPTFSGNLVIEDL